MRLLLLTAMVNGQCIMFNGQYSMVNAQITIGGNVYGGGNRGDLMGTTTVVVQSGTVEGDVYGGARMANVTPDATPSQEINEVTLPEGYATHVLIWGGTLHNVYGGNDITGDITGGTNVEIYSNVGGDIYGGGNGSYVYTDQESKKEDADYADLYYEVGEGKTSAEALNDFRPNIDKTLVHITGKSAELAGGDDPVTTYIGGRVFCGGNSATLRSTEGNPTANLQVGSHVVADNVFLGSNGENMVDNDILQRYADTSISSIGLTNAANFAEYMRGVDMNINPIVSFDEDYVDGSAYIGSFFVGGNVGSMSAAGTFNIDFGKQVVIYNKLVGGCNNANVAKSTYNAYHQGGLITAASPKVALGIEGLVLEPRKLSYDEDTQTFSFDWNKTTENMLIGGNIYGGCYQSGYINGGVTINLTKDAISAATKTIADNTNVQLLTVHRDSVLNTALSVFGAGYGKESEVWGNTTINITDNADIIKVFGGGEKGVVGQLERDDDGISTSNVETPYNTAINLLAGNVGKIYGGGFEGPVTGNTTVNLIGGTAYDVIGGACNSDIDGYAETYVGQTGASTIPTVTNNIYGGNDFGGRIRGSHDFKDRVNEASLASVYAYSVPDGSAVGTVGTSPLLSAHAYVEYIKGTANHIFGGAKASYDYKDQTYYYAYADNTGAPIGDFVKPKLGNAFVNFRPEYDEHSSVSRVYGAGQGFYNECDKDLLQDNSYVLIDIPADVEQFASMEVFGAGDYSGVGMDIAAATVRTNEETAGDITAAAVIDLVRGNINSVYGGSYKQGFTRRTIVNVPDGSTIDMKYLYGGAYGVAEADGNTLGNLYPCDVYESNVNFNSSDARCRSIYGGNNSYRRTLYTHVNINSPVQYVHNTYGLTHANIFGAGYGENTWAQYTEVNLNAGARVYEPYGGGEAGSVYNKESITSLAGTNGWSLAIPGDYTTTDASYDHGGLGNVLAHSNELYDDYHSVAAKYDINVAEKYNTNVHIYRDATVVNYAYGAGLGSHIYEGSNHRTTAVVSGTSYIDLLGGTVTKDLYAAGTTGAVQDTLGLKSFIASATAYIKGGSVRNVYGGGWDGPLGKHDDAGGHATTNDVLGVANVIIGRPEEDIAAEFNTAFAADPTIDADEFFYFNGVPAISRNAYAGGEGGVIRGTANLDIFNGVVGYRTKHKNDITASENNYYRLDVVDGHVKYIPMKRGDDLSVAEYYFVEEIDQDVVGDNIMYDAGNAFGGGYAANSDVDIANVTLWNGIIRNSMYGGGEIATIGRGTQTKNASNEFEVTIYKAGETHVTMMGGQVLRDVFGGGRGYNNWKTEDKSEGNTNGYIFGKTDVNIHMGTVGTLEGLSEGHGNVFGGGNIGFVYSQYDKKTDGWYYEDYANNTLSEDTRVEVKAYGKALESVTIDGTTYAKGDYIPNTALDKLTNEGTTSPLSGDKLKWSNIDQSGVTIYNAIFAGGNVSAGSDKIMAFSKTVYGNATAAVVDIFARDLVSVGGNGVGGLYGDGNLTFVDGYRELNITNYGTDWYTLSSGVANDDDFNALTTRQQSFYTTQYLCTEANNGYAVDDVIMYDVYRLIPDTDKDKWSRQQSTVNEGRYINTIQRCDFCGIKGSRLVLYGAIDRAQDETEADYTNYTINRVGELSLNQNNINGTNHGSYFGIYNVVKFLGGVTSDVPFSQERQTTSTSSEFQPASSGQTYYQWKQAHINDNTRNDGTAPNKIALSSGVYLEIVKELDNSGNKVYGPVTGVVELDLLNVSTGEGGGYVYAKNIHGTPSGSLSYANVISDANQNLVTNRSFTYADAASTDVMQTSGNFIHSQPKRILDDCFPEAKSFAGSGASPAHYWYIRGDYYVYEQLVSAYTGAADTYSSSMSIPLTMATQGKLRLLNIVPGLYADPSQLANYTYNAENPELSVSDSISIVKNAVVKTYGQGDPISYWDWYNATDAERNMFIVETGAYVCNTEATINGTTYYPGQAITKSTYDAFGDGTIVNEVGETVQIQSLFSVINEVKHDNGYLLTIDLSNPSAWDANSATFTCNMTGVYGQSSFEEDNIISKTVYDMQTSEVLANTDSETQAKFKAAYVAKEDCEVTVDGNLKYFNEGTPISADDYGNISSASTYFEPAYICVSTVQLGNGNFYVLNQLIGQEEYNALSTDVQNSFQPAYYCTSAGSWGGKYYVANNSYNGVDYCQLSSAERANFTYNYDALDALLYSKYQANHSNNAWAYNSVDDYTSFINTVGAAKRNNAISVFDNGVVNGLYGQEQKIEYTATFTSTDTGDLFTFSDNGTPVPVTSVTTLTSERFESLPNDRKYYASFTISADHLQSGGDYRTYIVKTTFDVAGKIYNAGESLTDAEYTSLSTQQQNNVDVVTIPAASGVGTYYYCISSYVVGADDSHITSPRTNLPNSTPAVTDINNGTTATGQTVQAGTIINQTMMESIPNYQANFEIHGETPIEETTLYVPVTADISALQRDRYVTAIYEYTYTESDAQGLNYETRVEKHIINIRIKFLNDTPVIGPLKTPDLVLPLETVGLDIPTIQEGAFPILGGGWEIYPDEQQAKLHRNGRDYINGGEPLYFYEDGYHVAYYALTRMGKTFSKSVPVTVANYQRMADVINDEYHMYINHRDNKRDPKIYIDSRSTDTYGSNISYNGTNYENELDAMQGMWDIVNSSYGTEYSEIVDGQSRNITGANGLEFFLQGEVASQLPSWTPIGDATTCFEGTFHGNGNAVTGLDNSLFGNLCGSVYNLGVMGSFTAGGVADTGDGRIENAWVWTSATPNGKAVYANPGTSARVINSFYPDANSAFTQHPTPNTIEVTQRPTEEFVNGSVAYDLNRFYLEGRYRLMGTVSGGSAAGSATNYLFFRQPDGTIKKSDMELTVDENGRQPDADDYVTTYANQLYDIYYDDADYTRFSGKGYVEYYVDDGDFRFSDGKKPLKADMRLSTDNGYVPLYPDDYIFFGQKLTYGILNDANGYPIAHATHPQGAAKNHTTGSGEDVDNSKHGLLINDINDRSENRVYRAPAYFQNGTYGRSAKFNARAVFVDSYDVTINGTTYQMQPHHGMTAIDFSGGNGDTHGYQGVVAGSASDFKPATESYKPLLDYERLDAFQTQGLTQNLLAYAPSTSIAHTKNEQTNDVLVNYFRDPDYSETDQNYRTVDAQNTTVIKGHVVQQASPEANGGTYSYTYTATTDHLLVDRQDFNAPMPYTFGSDYRMWYQRMPDNYVDRATGWEGISIPFSPELVTTHQKGELTHFYRGSTKGHEYWLRQFDGITVPGGSATGSVTATFNPMAAGSEDKEYTNTFLYDYYYSWDSYLDKNEDDYQKLYYASAKTFSDYPLADAGAPYIVGFPSTRYYEFDLSGAFVPQNTHIAIDPLERQTITFASEPGVTIAVSDVELQAKTKTSGDYSFTPNYLSDNMAVGTYVLDATGSSYAKIDDEQAAVPFRPYFVDSNPAKQTRAIFFSQTDDTFGMDDDPRFNGDYSLDIFAKKGKIVVASYLNRPAAVTIANASGIIISTFDIAPGETVTTPVNHTGVYAVGTNVGETKKLRVVSH